jgi:hypothetical protein
MIRLALAIAFISVFGLAFMWVAAKLASKAEKEDKQQTKEEQND